MALALYKGQFKEPRMSYTLEDSIRIPNMCRLLDEKPGKGEKIGSTANTMTTAETCSLMSGLTGGNGKDLYLLAAASDIICTPTSAL